MRNVTTSRGWVGASNACKKAPVPVSHTYVTRSGAWRETLESFQSRASARGLANRHILYITYI
jgi:hypothetical protein